MVGEKDFETSQNYSLLVKNIRNKLISLNHTNFVVCLPTFKCGKLSELFNRRIEIFNKLLHFDIQKYEYAYLLDSNLHLTYDYQMFGGPQGVLNNKGMLNVLSSLKSLIFDIQFYRSRDAHHDLFEMSQEEMFFRE